MSIKKIEFFTSKPDVKSCPDTRLPEYAFIGRSNVGKSSLINMLANHKKLAKTSSTPGKTRLINYFLVDGAWFLVDLPGYGYAKLSKKQKEVISKIIHGYINNRKSMECLFVLIDIRHSPLLADIEFIQGLGLQQIPFALVFTKCDKLEEAVINDKLSRYKAELMKDWEALPPIFLTSAKKGMGKDELISYIMEVNKKLG
jgi:GTP-binding protein